MDDLEDDMPLSRPLTMQDVRLAVCTAAQSYGATQFTIVSRGSLAASMPESAEKLRSTIDIDLFPPWDETKATWSAGISRAAFGVLPKARLLFAVAVIVFAMCLPASGQKPNDSAANDKIIREGWEQERKEAQAAYAKVFKEPLMVKIDPALPTVRFVCIRTFHRPFCIRVFRDAAGPKLRVVRFAGKGGYEWGKPDLDETRRITEEEWQKVFQAARTPDVHSPLRNMTPAEDVFFYGLDGSTWFLETNLQPKATFVRVWTPTAFVGKEAQEKPASVNLQPLCDFGMMLIKLAGLPSNDPEDRIY